MTRATLTLIVVSLAGYGLAVLAGHVAHGLVMLWQAGG